MATYPIRVRSQSLDHKSGTKSYHLMLIQTDDDRAVVVNRWGKKGQFGELQVKEFDHVDNAWKEYDRKERDKTRNGYSPVGLVRTATADQSSQLVKAVGLAVMNKIGKNAINFLDPDFDTTGMRELDEPRTDEDGRLTGRDTSRKADVSAQLEAQREADKAAAEASYASNPFYGMF